jgi:7,8-dihydropterin-6-yl-methyl-4-(beta-D-ribofuranosyl)aminobenzene 5'-phosphate synthase
MGLTITTLSENSASMGTFLGEWGFSVLAETGDKTILFDTGQSISAAHNADVLGVDLSKADKMVLSHGHFDHTGGLKSVLSKIGKEIEIIAHPDIWQKKYALAEGAEPLYIGIPFSRSELESLGAKFNLTGKPVKITPDITTTGEIPMVTPYEAIEPRMAVKENGNFKPDELLDDQALIINTEDGLVVILGCAHRGIINTLKHAQNITGIKEIYAVIGGCHLINAPEERIWLTVNALKELEVKKLGVSHCTGMAASAIMAQEFGDKFFFNNAGTIVELP